MNHKLIGYYVMGLVGVLLLVALVGGGVVLYKSVQENARLEMSAAATELNIKINEEILQEVHDASTENSIKADRAEAELSRILKSNKYIEDWRNTPVPADVSKWMCETYFVRQGEDASRAAETCAGTKASFGY